MRRFILSSLVITGALFVHLALADDVDLKTARAVVVKTEPPAGSDTVDPNLIRVTFSKDMTDHSWTWSTAGKDNFPKITDKPHYIDARTCVLPVELQPGKTYATWLNSQKFGNFRDADGTPAVPYLLVFKTTGTPTTEPASTQPAVK